MTRLRNTLHRTCPGEREREREREREVVFKRKRMRESKRQSIRQSDSKFGQTFSKPSFSPHSIFDVAF